MNYVPVLKDKYRSKWIDHYDESLWSNFTKFPFPVPSSEEEASESKHFIHQLMFHSMFNYFNDQHERQKILESRLEEAEKKLAQRSHLVSSGESSSDVIICLLEEKTTAPKCDSAAAAANDDNKIISTRPLETVSDQEPMHCTTITIDSGDSSDESSPSLLNQNLFQRPTLVPNRQLKENKFVTTLGKPRTTVKHVAAPFATNNYTKSGWIKPGLKPKRKSSGTVKSNLILADRSTPVQPKEKGNPDVPTEVAARNEYNASNPPVPGTKRKSDELYSSRYFSSSSDRVGHISSSDNQINKRKVEGDDNSEELDCMDYEGDEDDNGICAEHKREKPSHSVYAIKEEPREAVHNDGLPGTSQSQRPVSTTTAIDSASLSEDTLKMLQGFDKLPRSNESGSTTYKYKPDKVVRKKDERARLPGFVCDMCREYYEAQDLSAAEVQKLLHKCSKHRALYEARTNTPPDYWRTDFPTTEECIEKGYLNIEEHDPTIDPKIRNRI